MGKPNLLVSFLFLTAILCGAFLLTTFPEVKKADAESCAIYRTVYETFVRQPYLGESDINDIIAVKPSTIAEGASDSLGRSTNVTRFEADTDQTEVVISALGLEHERIITKPFGFDASTLVADHFSNQSYDIRNCFSGLDVPPQLDDIDLQIIFQQDLKYDDDKVSPIILWSFTSPVLSRNGNDALIYVDYYCGGLCGGDYYLLLQKVDEQWVLRGTQLISVS